jgi:hypothetical protein
MTTEKAVAPRRLAGTALAICVLALAAGAASAASPPPVTKAQQAIEDAWGERGIWKSDFGIWFSGFKNEQEYLNPNNPEPKPAPLNAQARAFRIHVREELGKGRAIYNPTSQCLPFGVPYLLAIGTPFEIQFSKDRAMMLYENSEYRIIYMDGRPHPADFDPSFHGHSIGHWEGDTLVVDTVGIKGKQMQIEPHVPFTSQMHVVERWTPAGPDKIKLDIVMTDPGTLTEPWKVSGTMSRQKDWDLYESVCTENNRIVQDASGANTALGTDGQPLKPQK